MKTTFNQIFKEVTSKKQKQRIKSISKRLEHDIDSIIREVILNGFQHTRFGTIGTIEKDEYILSANIDLLKDVYSGVNFDVVMDKLYPLTNE